MILIHRYRSLTDGEDLQSMVVNHGYLCEIIFSNLSAATKEVSLLY
jgi:hypothetical protein